MVTLPAEHSVHYMDEKVAARAVCITIANVAKLILQQSCLQAQPIQTEIHDQNRNCQDHQEVLRHYVQYCQ